MGCEVEEVSDKQADSIEAKQLRKGFDVNTESQQTATNGTKLRCDTLYSRTMATGGLEPTGLNAIDTIETKGQHSCQNGKANSDRNENICDNGQCSDQEQSKKDHCESTKTEIDDGQNIKTENADDQNVKTDKGDERGPSRGACGGTSSDGNQCTPEIEAEIYKKLGQLKEQLGKCSDIEEILFDVPLSCLKDKTLTTLCYHLDIENEIMTSDDKLRDYRGMGEWIGLEAVFIRYVSGAVSQYKTKEIISKWMTLDKPKPTLGNLRKCLLDMDRPDVLEDMAVTISRDGTDWQITSFEAKKGIGKSTAAQDTSWQLTRHDVVSRKKTMYTACMLYADEDELMAELIINLYKKAYKQALFFVPQFDLKVGKWELDTTAQVIDQRCDKKVVFLLSEYFYASTICQFAVNYVAAHGTGHGNLIPFHLTRNVTHVPNVLKGIAGIRWFRKATRKHTWEILTDSLLAEKLSETEETREQLRDIKEKIMTMVEKDEETYLQDPPYDADTEPPGEPIELIEPLETPPSLQAASMAFDESSQAEEFLLYQRNKKKEQKEAKWKRLKSIKRALLEKVFKLPHSKSCSQESESMTPLRTFKETIRPKSPSAQPNVTCLKQDSLSSVKKDNMKLLDSNSLLKHEEKTGKQSQKTKLEDSPPPSPPTTPTTETPNQLQEKLKIDKAQGTNIETYKEVASVATKNAAVDSPLQEATKENQLNEKHTKAMSEGAKTWSEPQPGRINTESMKAQTTTNSESRARSGKIAQAEMLSDNDDHIIVTGKVGDKGRAKRLHQNVYILNNVIKEDKAKPCILSENDEYIIPVIVGDKERAKLSGKNVNNLNHVIKEKAKPCISLNVPCDFTYAGKYHGDCSTDCSDNETSSYCEEANERDCFISKDN